MKDFLKELNKTKKALLIAQIVVGFAIIGILISVISFTIKTNQYVGTELTNYISNTIRNSDLFRINALVFELNWTPEYIKSLYIYHLLGNIPFMVLLIYIFEKLKVVFIPFEDQNEPFTLKSIKAFRTIGYGIIVWFAVKMTYDLIYPMNLMILHNSAYQESDLIGSASLSLNITVLIITAIIASIFIGLSQIFKRGLEIKEDNDTII